VCSSDLLDFGGRHAAGTFSTQLQYYQRMQIVGTRARLEIESPFNARPDRPCRMAFDRTGDLRGTGLEVIEVDVCNQFTRQAEEFAAVVLDNRPQPAPLEDAVANMASIDALFRSSTSGRWEVPSGVA